MIKYRGYKHFDNHELIDELIRDFSSSKLQPDDLSQFPNILTMVLEKMASLKKRDVRKNRAKFMNKIFQS